MKWFLSKVFILTALVTSTSAYAVSVGKTAKDNSVKAQLEAFKVHPDFEINLFADESMGIANPIAMHWDERGRLWVLTTLTYAQLKPGQGPNDTLVILEDTDADGKADKSTVYADGLDMPMGFALYRDGVYIGEGADLLFLNDEDGDGVADSREVVLTGFGTGDTHQNISNFTWGPDGCLYFSQGLHCYSRVETPWGIVRGDTAGFWRFNPRNLRLDPYCFPSLASQNPCGIIFDKEGSLFIKSNNKELIFATPGLIPTTHQKDLGEIGNMGSTPGKSMGGEYVISAHLPDWLQNHILIAGYYSHRVSAYPLVKEDSGFAKVEPLEILSSEHSSFRPVEVRIGGDGAIYVADWFNPIIGHYQASLRHPDRDAEHGRIWRLTAKGRELSEELPLYHQLRGSEEVTEAPLTEIGEDPRVRLRAIVGLANSGEPDALSSILKALDYPRDRFIDYALEQSVHALAKDWLPAVESGKLKIGNTEHLAFALETIGGTEALEIAKRHFAKEGVSDEERARFAEVIAKTGGPEDLRSLINRETDAATLKAIVEQSGKRRVRPSAGYEDDLLALLGSGDTEVRTNAIRIAGLWNTTKASDPVRRVMMNKDASTQLRGTAAGAFAQIEKGKAAPVLLELWSKESDAVKPALIAALADVAPVRAAQEAAGFLAGVSSAEMAIPFVSPFLAREKGPQELAEALKKVGISKESATVLSTAMSEMGRGDEALLGVIQDAMGVASGARAYSAEFVKELAAEVVASGDPEAGGKIYQRAELTCFACHQLKGIGGIIGPSLDTVGAGLTPDLLIESVLWPQRQLKEGYFSTVVSTKGGDTYSGYKEKDDAEFFYLKDTASGEVKAIQRVEISKITNAGSLMPQGLTNSLSHEELRDLIAYLATLKG
ncbi:PVC-type heme-binding CxxCH protein [Verrucomicrobiales bacterium BCK34]|nr:PVC-type heme-binding CxxCH protein [Verrucomicrobiales bacterium BCK34]